MAASTIDRFEEYIKNLLKCSLCLEPVKSAPIHQCTNGNYGSIICTNCVPKLEKWQIQIIRNWPLEAIIENTFDESEIQKWGQESKNVPIKIQV